MNFSKENFKAALIRAIRTMAQVALGYITVGATLSSIDWKNMVSVVLVSAIYSILTSIVTGLPESEKDGTLQIDTSGEKDVYRLDVGSLESLGNKKSITLVVNNEANLMESGEDDIN